MKTKPAKKAKPVKIQLAPKPKSQRPRCQQCTKTLEPQFTTPPATPAKLLDGRRKAERDAWEQAHPPVFTGNYGRCQDNRFCGVSCGYNYAVAHTRAPK